jgi:hypothetical protein
VQHILQNVSTAVPLTPKNQISKSRKEYLAYASSKAKHKIVTFVSLKGKEITRRILRKRKLRRIRSRGRREKKGGRKQEEENIVLI